VAFQGIVPTSITREGEQIDYRVQLDTGREVTNQMIKQLQISNRMGELIDLEAFTKMEEKKGYDVIRHYNGRRSITITGDVDDKVITSKEINSLIYNKFNKRVESLPGVQLVFGGEEKATQESLRSWGIAFLCTLVAIYFVLIMLFGSFWQPFIIMTAIPFGLAGVVIVFYLHGLKLSFLGMIGCLGLIGIIVNDGLIMLSHLNSISKDKPLTLELCVQGARDRFRAVLLTTITTVSGMVPTIYGFGGSEPFIIPIVLAVAGGLVFATTVTLILVPVLYSFGIKNLKNA
jgi:multidrug efflux pump subunit AcrB